jgi:hypothetical protein
MKTKHLLLTLISTIIFTSLCRAAAPVDLSKLVDLEGYALKYVAKHDDETGLDAYINDDLGLPKADADVVRKSVKVMLTVKAKGYVVGKQAFSDAVKKLLGMADSVPASTSTPAVATPVVSTPPAPKDVAPATDQAEIKKTVKDAMREAWKAKDEAEANFKSYQAFFNVGVNLLNPHKILPIGDSPTNRRTIEPKSNTEVGGFLEFVYTNRWAWNEDRVQNAWWKSHKDAKNLGGLGEADQQKYRKRLPSTQAYFSKEGVKLKAFLQQVDVQFRLGYFYSKDSELSANTLVGSSDLSAELDVSFPLVAHDSVTGAFSVGPDFSYAATTDRSAMDVHHRWFAGLGYTASFESPYTDDHHRRILLHTRLGYAHVESVRFLNEQTREIYTYHEGTPRYFGEKALGFETEIFYPVRAHSFLTLGARIYGGTNPNPWNVYLGITTPLSSLLDGILPK